MKVPIKPLQKIPTGGRPTYWRPEVPSLYRELLGQGYSHNEILEGWQISDTTFWQWRKRSPELDTICNGIDPTCNSPPFSKEEMQKLANELLHDLMTRMKAQPHAYKPNEIITACKEALDRTEGKPVQSTIIDQNTTYTIVSAIPAAPNSLPAQQAHNQFPAKQDIKTNYEVIDNEKG